MNLNETEQKNCKKMNEEKSTLIPKKRQEILI